MDYQLRTGCIPCNFVCDCCNILYSRCCSGVGMYCREKSFYEPDHMLCENCYQNCQYTKCKVKDRDLPDD